MKDDTYVANPSNIQAQNPDEEDSSSLNYVCDLQFAADEHRVVCARAKNIINIIDPESLRQTDEMCLHNGQITGLRVASTNPHIFWTSSSDGTMGVWDMREKCITPSVSRKIRRQGEIQALAVGLDDTLVAYAVETSVTFDDMRVFLSSGSSSSSHGVAESSSQAHLAELSDLHTDLITQIEFHPSNGHMLATASEDGLISFHDLTVGDEEDMTTSTLSIECPVSKFGFFGPQNEGLYCATTVESLSCWHVESATRLCAFDDLREKSGCNYVVDCFYDEGTQSLTAMTGSFDGTGQMLSISPDGTFQPIAKLAHGHTDMLRCAARSRSSLRFLTGGEDARVVDWQASW